jgi:hypothetical protein
VGEAGWFRDARTLWKIDFVLGPKKKLVHGEQGRRWEVAR